MSSKQLRIEWRGSSGSKGPRRILFLARPGVESIGEALAILLSKGIHVLMEEAVWNSMKDVDGEGFEKHVQRSAVGIFNPEYGSSGVDLIITFGGDGLLMHCNSLFQGSASVPPIISFDFGIMSFLAPFAYDKFEEEIDSIIKDGAVLTLRMRLECTIWRGGPDGPKESFSHHVLNEAVIDRGIAPSLAVIDVSCNQRYLTTIQGDGLIIATPTGSTAYSLAAGGSMVHPSVPAILITPICAHTLSIRPLLLPSSSVLQCDLPLDARANGYVSFDGQFRQELLKGDSVKIRLSSSPLSTVARDSETGDWLNALRSGFNFNHRARQTSSRTRPDGPRSLGPSSIL